MTDEDSLARYYREISLLAFNSTRIKKILKKVQKAANKGLTSISIRVERGDIEFLRYGTGTSSPLIKQLYEMGFTLENDFEPCFLFGSDYQLHISW